MAKPVSHTLYGDAPLSAAHPDPDGAFDLPAVSRNNYELIGRTITVNRPRAQLYHFWRQFSNLARFLQNVHSVHSVHSVQESTPLRVRWIMAASADQTVEWESTVIEDIPNELIAWRSIEGSRVASEGRVEFSDAPGDRGTRVTATILLRHSGGAIGELLAKLFHHDSKVQTRRELRRFKQLMETGEISIIEVTSTAICGSDLHLYDHYIPTMKSGDVLGHEFMGEVVEVGPGNSQLKVGDRVVVPFVIACGSCFFLRA